MEPSDRSPCPWRRWNVNAQDPLTELENPPADQDSSPQQALDACFEPDPRAPSPLQQALDDCFGPDPARAPSPSPLQQALDCCFEFDSVRASFPSPPSSAPFYAPSPPPPSVPSSPSGPQYASFGPDPAGAPLPPPPPSPPHSIVLHPPPACADQSRFKLLPLLEVEDMPSASDSFGGHGADINDGRTSGEGAGVPQYRFKLLPLLDDDEDLPLTSDSSGCPSGDEDEECSIGNPFLTDSFGNQTTWRLSDLNAEFTKYLEEEASKPKEKKFTKEERLKFHSDRMERYMKSALQKYNDEEKLPEDMYFEFDKIRSQNWIVEGDYDNQYYYHFNFSATQACSTTCLFFAEVTPGDGDSCDITCCKLLNDGENGHCYGCKNAHVDDLRHPACLNVYVGGHVDRKFPFLVDTESEDDSEDDTV